MTSFSIIIPVYNGDSWLPTAIDSALNQSVRPIQIILVDDGSTDDSWKICKEYSEKRPLITAVQQSNRGVSAARNTGLHYVTGDYIVFLDCDDCLPEGTLATYRHHADKYSCPDILLGRVDRIVNNVTDCVFQSTEREIQIRDSDFIDSIVNYNFKSSPYGNLRGIWGKAYNSEVIRKNQLQFDENIKIGEDMAFLLDFACNSQRALTMRECVYHFCVVNMASAMKTVEWDGGLNAKNWLNKVKSTKEKYKIEISENVIFFEASERYWIALIQSGKSFAEKRKILREMADTLDYREYTKMSNREIGVLYPFYSFVIRHRWILFWMLLIKVKQVKETAGSFSGHSQKKPRCV